MHSAQLSATQAEAAKAIVNIFETGAVRGRYGAVTVLPGDSGRLTYGRAQTTLGTGNLHLLLTRYCAADGARFGRRLRGWLPALAARSAGVDTDGRLHNVLRAAADDPVMREVQDRFFDEAYWEPALRAAGRMGILSALGVAVVYDSLVHGSWPALRDRAGGEAALRELGEAAWLRRYVATRRQWLAGHDNALLHRTVYRMDALLALMDQGAWALQLPLVVRGLEISAQSLSALPPGCYAGPQPGARDLRVQSPLQRGLDVRLVQLALSDLGCALQADGLFGHTTARFIRGLQHAQRLPETGVADAAWIRRWLAPEG